jgi:hypothetical protein
MRGPGETEMKQTDVSLGSNCFIKDKIKGYRQAMGHSAEIVAPWFE